MSGAWVLLMVLGLMAFGAVRSDDTDYNTVNEDGSFKFSLSNSDVGGHYHSATGTSDQVVRGRYGSRSPATNQLEQVVYTAGPRGFRARGANIHRNMDLSQVPRGPQGSADDPLADPLDDPSYGFRFRTADYQRREDADRLGRVNGLYSYLDDVGERHSVRYAAGAGTGYQVLNAVPDTPSVVKYNAPLYKTNRPARGKVSYERGPGGQYKFIASAPDQRRSESTGADGITRGSYSYLDDKGVQRTVEYIAGANIGYKVVQSLTGPGKHLNVRPAIPQFGPAPSTDISDAEGSGFKKGGGSSISSGVGGGAGGAGGAGSGFYAGRNQGQAGQAGQQTGKYGGNSGSGSGSNSGFGATGSSSNSAERNSGFGTSAVGGRTGGNSAAQNWDKGSGRGTAASGSSESGRGSLYGAGQSGGSGESSRGSAGNRFGSGDSAEARGSPSAGGGFGGTAGAQAGSSAGRFGGSSTGSAAAGHGGSGSGEYSSSIGHSGGGAGSSASGVRGGSGGGVRGSSFVTSNEASLAIDRNRDWTSDGRDSTIVKNVGKWYVGLPPGSAVRAHVQNIDLLPIGGRPPSPSEALRKDVQGRSRNYDQYGN